MIHWVKETVLFFYSFDMDDIYMTPEGKSYREVYICEPEDYIPASTNYMILLFLGWGHFT